MNRVRSHSLTLRMSYCSRTGTPLGYADGDEPGIYLANAQKHSAPLDS